MDNEKIINEDNSDSGEEIRMSNFSMIISIVFVSLVVVFLFAKIMFD
ncbi:MAG TPA: hypothetical protein PK504_05675 [Ferruginibacter sp.]|nr:hypothetical protein [Ferruginibacter sp.]HRE63467.1 hypothetical protein [Ferruginibacter sp.]